MRTDGRTDMKKVIVSFHNFAKEVKNYFDSLTKAAVFTFRFSAEITEAKWLSSDAG